MNSRSVTFGTLMVKIFPKFKPSINLPDSVASVKNFVKELNVLPEHVVQMNWKSTLLYAIPLFNDCDQLFCDKNYHILFYFVYPFYCMLEGFRMKLKQFPKNPGKLWLLTLPEGLVIFGDANSVSNFELGISISS